MQNGKISILMGIYNCEPTLEQAVDSILIQTYENWELIMCDDGSSDCTYDLACRLREKAPEKIQVIRNEHNMRLAATLNHCAEFANGEFIARMDADDISVADRFSKQVSFLQAHPQYELVGTYMQAFDDSGEKNVIAIKSEPQPTDLPKFNPFHHATVMMRTEAFRALNGYRIARETTRAEDVDLWFRFFKAGYRGYNLAEPLYKVREDPAAFRRRTMKHSLEASRVLIHGIRLLNLPAKYYIFALKPIISQITPMKLKQKFRKNMDEKNRRTQ